jgi:hypothetical protein
MVLIGFSRAVRSKEDAVRLEELKLLLAALLITTSPGLALAQLANLPPDVRAAIAEMGPHVDPSIVRKTYALTQPLQANRADLSLGQDVSYGSDPLQKLDVYAEKESGAAGRPIVVFVHGGGFTAGDKSSAQNVASYFAGHGMVGVSMNYRLAPSATWPEQSIDVGRAVAWLNANAAQYGGDPRRIVVIGYSSAASVVAPYLFDRSIDHDARQRGRRRDHQHFRLHGQRPSLLWRRPRRGRGTAAAGASERKLAGALDRDGRIRSGLGRGRVA